MKFLKIYLTTSIEIIINCFLLTLLYYYDIISNYSFSFLLLLSILLCLLYNSFLLGKTSTKKGYIEGLKIGLLFTISFLIITLITSHFNLKLLLYYFIIIITSILGSIIGINKKKT